jgi:hypothetical protein
MSDIHDKIHAMVINYDYSYGGKNPLDCNSLMWYEQTMEKKLYQYFNGTIKISPQLHKLVYGEEINPKNLVLTNNIFEHIKYMHCYAGGFNNNDYHRLPISFTRHTFHFVKDYPKTNTYENHTFVMNDLCKKYNFSSNYADVIAQGWLYKPWNKIICEQARL